MYVIPNRNTSRCAVAARCTPLFRWISTGAVAQHRMVPESPDVGAPIARGYEITPRLILLRHGRFRPSDDLPPSAGSGRKGWLRDCRERPARVRNLECSGLRRPPEAETPRVPAHHSAQRGLPPGATEPPPALASNRRHGMDARRCGAPEEFPTTYPRTGIAP